MGNKSKLAVLWVTALLSSSGIGLLSHSWAMMNFRGDSPLEGNKKVLESIGNSISDVFTSPITSLPPAIMMKIPPASVFYICTICWASVVMIPVTVIVLKKTNQ